MRQEWIFLGKVPGDARPLFDDAIQLIQNFAGLQQSNIRIPLTLLSHAKLLFFYFACCFLFTVSLPFY